MSTTKDCPPPVGMDVYVPENIAEYLDAFYRKVNPEKAGNAQQIANKFRGAEYRLFNKLLEMYKEDPWPRVKPAPAKTVPTSGKVPEEKKDSSSELSASRQHVLNELRKEINTLRDSVVSLSEENSKMKQSVDTLTVQCNKFKAASLEKDETIKSLQEDYYELKEVYEKLGDELNQSHEEVESMKSTISAMKENEEKMKSSIQEKESEIANLRAGLESNPASDNVGPSASTIAKEKDEEISALQSQVSHLQEDLEKATKRVEELSTIQTLLIAEKSKMEGDQQSSIKRAEELEAEMNKLKDDHKTALATIAAEKSKVEDELQSALTRADELEVAKSQLENELKEAHTTTTAEKSKVENDLQLALQRVDEVTAEKSKVESELEHVKSQNVQLTQKVQSLRKTKEELERECDSLDRQIADYQLKCEQMQHELSKAQSMESTSSPVATGDEDENRVELTVVSVMARNEELEKSVIHLKKKVEELEKKNQEMVDQFSTDLAASEEEKKQLEAEMQSMQQQIAELEKVRDDVSTQLACVKETITLLDTKGVEKEEALKQKEKQLDEVYEECEVLKTALAEARKSVEASDQENTQLKSSNSDLVKENTHLKSYIATLESQPMEALSQLNNSLIVRLDSMTSQLAQPGLPQVAASIDLSRFTLLTFLDFLQDTFTKQLFPTNDMEKAISEDQQKEIRSFLLDRVNSIQSLLTIGFMPREWVDSDKTVDCHNCHNEFSFINRKHHCRYCGNVFCEKCSAKEIMLPNETKKQRVCDSCFDLFFHLSNYFKNQPEKA